RFFVPTLVGLLVGLLSALTLFLIPVSFSDTTIWNRVGEVYNQVHYPASRLAAAWRSAGLPPHAEGALGVCAIVAQWLLLGMFAGAIWLYIGRFHAKARP